MFNQPISGPNVQRQPGNAVPEVALVRSLRALGKSAPEAQTLWEELFRRCEGLFQRHARGLSHRPDLKEEALANMREHLLRTVMDPAQQFITQNFPHTLRCIASEEFTRLLRREGMLSLSTERPRNGMVPLHVPRSLLVSIEGSQADGETHSLFSQLPCYDPYEGLLASMEVQRILDYLRDPRDRVIVFLRAVESMKWDDIALCCHCTGRTARMRYGQACAFLRDVLSEEQVAEEQGVRAVSHLRAMPPVLKRVSVQERRMMNNRGRTERKRQAVLDAVSALMEEGKPATKQEILTRAHVSSSFLRGHPDLVKMIAAAGTADVPASENG